MNMGTIRNLREAWQKNMLDTTDITNITNEEGLNSLRRRSREMSSGMPRCSNDLVGGFESLVILSLEMMIQHDSCT
jgi:hypothetical protein